MHGGGFDSSCQTLAGYACDANRTLENELRMKRALKAHATLWPDTFLGSQLEEELCMKGALTATAILSRKSGFHCVQHPLRIC